MGRIALTFTHKSLFSESLIGQMQGALLQQGWFPCKRVQRRQMAGQRLARRESFQTGHTCVAALGKGTTLACAPRLVLTHPKDSEA